MRTSMIYLLGIEVSETELLKVTKKDCLNEIEILNYRMY